MTSAQVYQTNPISWRVLGLNKLKHPSLTAFCSFAADTRKVERRRTTSCLQEQTALSKGVRSAINWCPNVQTAPRARLLVVICQITDWLMLSFWRSHCFIAGQTAGSAWQRQRNEGRLEDVESDASRLQTTPATLRERKQEASMEWSEKKAIVKLLRHAILALGEGSNNSLFMSANFMSQHASPSVFSHWPRLCYGLTRKAYSAHAYNK